MGPRMREDKGWGEGRLCAEKTGVGVGEGMGPRVREVMGGAYGCEIPRGTRNEMWVEGEENHPHPFDKLRAGSNVPPSRGKGEEIEGDYSFALVLIVD